MTQPKPKKPEIWIILAVGIVINVSLAAFVTWPLLLGILATQSRINDAEARIARLDQERSHFLNLERLVLKEAGVFQRIENTILSLAKPLPFIELVESLAKERGLSIKILVRDAPTGGMQNFQIVTEGDFPRTYQYLRLLELIPYQLSFSHFQLEFFERGSSETSIKAQKESLRNAKQPIIARLTLDLAARAK